MSQNSYNTIIACIQYGAPALAPQLLEELNTVINNSNNYIQAQRDAAAAKAKDEAKADTEAKAKK